MYRIHVALLSFICHLTLDSQIADWILRRYFIPPWASVLEEKAGAVMLNSGTLNGVPGHADRERIEGLLRSELGFEGFTLSDYEDVKKLFTIHGVAPNYPEVRFLLKT